MISSFVHYQIYNITNFSIIDKLGCQLNIDSYLRWRMITHHVTLVPQEFALCFQYTLNEVAQYRLAMYLFQVYKKWDSSLHGNSCYGQGLIIYCVASCRFMNPAAAPQIETTSVCGVDREQNKTKLRDINKSITIALLSVSFCS